MCVLYDIVKSVCVCERGRETVGSYVMCLSLSGDAQNERERSMMIKGQIEEELRQLEDEIAACKWGYTSMQTRNVLKRFSQSSGFSLYHADSWCACANESIGQYLPMYNRKCMPWKNTLVSLHNHS